MAYVGPPYFLAVYQVTNYVSKEMKGIAEAAGIKFEVVPVENPPPPCCLYKTPRISKNW